MKANELMIGDWVEYRFTGWTEKGGVYKDYQYVQISSIGQLYIKADNDRVASADGVEFYPIPLTPKILEKNGFIYLDENVWGKTGTEINIYLDCGVFAIITHKGFLCLGGRGEIHFVHELQHALRLCGIEKEIVL